MKDLRQIHQTLRQNLEDIGRHVADQALHEFEVSGDVVEFGEGDQQLFEFK
jgi:hypothetical protein